MENLRLTTLFNKAIDKTITGKDRVELFDLMCDPENALQIEYLFAAAWENFNPSADKTFYSDATGKAMLTRIWNNGNDLPFKVQKVSRYLKPWPKIIAAASIALVVGISSYFYIRRQAIENLPSIESMVKSDISPGSQKAILTLGNGRKLILDNAKQGLLAKEAGVDINKLADGQISYEVAAGSTATEEETSFNSIAIPRGGHYTLTLPDGTKVHLNSETTLKYPAKFNSDSRTVDLVGEAYFEVKHNEKQPFYVKTQGQVTKVLGTVFNINAYKGEPILKTTLIEGAVSVTGENGHSVILKPGETAVNKNDQLDITSIDVNEILAWHKGYFLFANEDIKSIMKKISRWYDIDVEYIGDMSNKKFGGVFQRTKSILQLLKSLKQTGIIDFKIKERRVIVIDKQIIQK